MAERCWRKEFYCVSKPARCGGVFPFSKHPVNAEFSQIAAGRLHFLLLIQQIVGEKLLSISNKLFSLMVHFSIFAFYDPFFLSMNTGLNRLGRTSPETLDYFKNDLLCSGGSIAKYKLHSLRWVPKNHIYTFQLNFLT